jgi:hypothetical protein
MDPHLRGDDECSVAPTFLDSDITRYNHDVFVI